MNRSLHLTPALLLLAPLGAAQHSQSSSVAVDPTDASEVWACNRGNDSVSVIDVSSGTTEAEIVVGVWPRSVAFTPDGTTAFVANQRGNVDVTTHFVTPFTGSEVRGSISVVDVASRTVTQTLTNVGTEPYGLAVAPNGEYFAVTGFRSGTVKFYDTSAPYNLLHTFQYDHTLNFIGAGKTVIDVDSNLDMIPDLAEPRTLVITSTSDEVWVVHSLSGFVSVLDLTLASGEPTGAALGARIDLNTYAEHPIFNPTPVQVLASQGVPRFLDDLALSPDGSRALVPHLLHNINHDVNHAFGPGLAGDFANRVYPALTMVDAAGRSYAAPADASNRLHHELDDPLDPAEYVAYGGQGTENAGGIYTMGGLGAPVLGGTADFVVTGTQPGDVRFVLWSNTQVSVPFPFGTILTLPNHLVALAGTTYSLNIPNNPGLDGKSFFFQSAVLDGGLTTILGLTNGVEMVIGSEGFGQNQMGYRAGHPGRVLYNAAGDRALLLNRGSEDVFLYEVNGSDLELMSVFPPRHGHVERVALDTATPLGDLPLGMALVADPTTTNDDALLYVINETSRTLSSLRIDFEAGTMQEEAAQIPTLLGPDQMTLSERVGQELFEDASRAQTAGNFNNACSSCHFEGQADGNVWQRSDGPRSTMPVTGGTLLTGLILWKGVRLNMGETGPMFGGENGGHGILTDSEQQGLVDYHEIIPVPLNPNLDPVTGDYVGEAAFGKDLFFGNNATGMNPSGRFAGCANCHPDNDGGGMPRGYTADFLDPVLTGGENLGTVDPLCFSLQDNAVTANLRNVNSAVNVDVNGDTIPDPDRNADGFNDLESYVPMNVDGASMFTRDDPNSYPCPVDPFTDPNGPKKVFTRDGSDFSIPTKLGVFSTGPYFHDHSVASLRLLLDPGTQQTDPKYGHPSYPRLNKFLNEFHDIRGDDTFVLNASKVQVTLQTTTAGSTVDADLQALLEYISSL